MREHAQWVWGRKYGSGVTRGTLWMTELILAVSPAWAQEAVGDRLTGSDLCVEELSEQFAQLTQSQAIVV
ncbi:hypothetical protein [Thermogutta sp.]|uniref:hypothetical protein n=1 Tax=Thermogutta sp. TaxID=1962930 RepID=UPI00321FE88F